MGESLKTTGDNISNAGKKLLPVTATVTALGTASVTTATNFESSMSQVQVTMDITKDSMNALCIMAFYLIRLVVSCLLFYMFLIMKKSGKMTERN